MPSPQQVHIDTVMRTVGGGLAPWDVHPADAVIHDSWRRCVSDHRLDPTRMQEAVILPGHRLREHQDQLDAFLQIARHGLESLYAQVAGLGYCVLLTDARGVTVDFLGDLVCEPSLRKAGLYLGADWSEPLAGTCGVGTCIATGEALTVHRTDHFDATHIPLTCTAAPVYDDQGRLTAVLDISALSAPSGKESQHLALQLVKVYAGHIENASFLQRFRRHWVLRLSRAPQFLDVHPEWLLALDEGGRVVGHNRAAQLALEAEVGGPVLGCAFERLFDLPLAALARYTEGVPGDRRAVTLAGSGHVRFLRATPPPPAPRPARVVDAGVPAPLAALSGGDPVLDRLIERAGRLVNSPVNMLLTGETGTGKEYLARALHEASERRRQPFVAVNCAAIPESLIESELFGHLPGSFSGAGPRGKRGLIQEADGGTLFLDEIGDMPLALQARLLRVLAEHEVLPIGATRPVAVSLRVVAATHCDLVAAVRAGRFRDDLYYRLNGAHFQLPPLRERADLAWLVDRMLQAGGAPVAALSPAARALLAVHPWPGNLRELRNVLDYARSLCRGGVITPDDLPEALVTTGGCVEAATAEPPRLAVEHPAGASEPVSVAPGQPPADTPAQALHDALRASGWNVAEAARRLGLSRMTLYRRMQRWGVTSPNRRDGAAPPSGA